MGSLTTCLRRAGQFLDSDDKAAIVEAARIYRADGVPADEAARRAVEERLQAVQRELEVAQRAAPEVQALPVPEARELSVDEAEALAPTEREAELARLRDAATDPEVRKDLDRQVNAERKRAGDLVRGEEYLRLADQTTDAGLKTELEAKAAKLGAGRIVPVGEAAEIDEAVWRAAHSFGTLNAERSKAVVRALVVDRDATRAAVEQYQRSPTAFDRQIQRILDQGDRRESQPEEAPGSGGGLPAPAGRGQGGEPRGDAGRGQGEAVGEDGAAAQAEGQVAPTPEEVSAAARVLASARKPKPESDPDAAQASLSPDAARPIEGDAPDSFSLSVRQSGRELRLDPAEDFFAWVGADKAGIWADTDALLRKHPEHFNTQADVRQALMEVLEAPEFALPATKPEYTLLVAHRYAEQGDRAAGVVELELRGGKYRVRSVYRMPEAQLQKKLADAEKQGGSVRSRSERSFRSPGEQESEPSSSSGSPAAPSDAGPTQDAKPIVAAPTPDGPADAKRPAGATDPKD